MQLVKQRYSWDCGVCCLAMALKITWEQAHSLLAVSAPSYGADLARAANVTVPRDYAGTLERCIIQVSGDHRFPYHWVWSENGLYCPAQHFRKWGQIRMIGQIIHIPEVNNVYKSITNSNDH